MRSGTDGQTAVSSGSTGWGLEDISWLDEFDTLLNTVAVASNEIAWIERVARAHYWLRCRKIWMVSRYADCHGFPEPPVGPGPIAEAILLYGVVDPRFKICIHNSRN